MFPVSVRIVPGQEKKQQQTTPLMSQKDQPEPTLGGGDLLQPYVPQGIKRIRSSSSRHRYSIFRFFFTFFEFFSNNYQRSLWQRVLSWLTR